MQGLLNFAEKEEILNLCHISEDGRLKTLSFSATDGQVIFNAGGIRATGLSWSPSGKRY